MISPSRDEYVVDKAGKGAFGQSNLPLVLRNLGITHLVITGITTDVCV
ncbi:MAG: isochorismatase family protein [Candidatus Nitrosopolaris sp.]